MVSCGIEGGSVRRREIAARGGLLDCKARNRNAADAQRVENSTPGDRKGVFGIGQFDGLDSRVSGLESGVNGFEPVRKPRRNSARHGRKRVEARLSGPCAVKSGFPKLVAPREQTRRAPEQVPFGRP